MSEEYGRPAKRQKLDDEESITRPDQIHQWLEFRQSTNPEVKAGINAFKDFLSSISRSEETIKQANHYRILKEYCQWQRATSENQVDFYDVLSTWSFAVDNNSDAINSAAPAALAQFLKTISGVLELRVFGLALIDSLLKRDQSKLFEKCLISPRTKPHLASPCLRLLTEMISFDAGARATELWYRRDLIMPKFEAVLESQTNSDGREERKKPTVRRMALRLLIAMLRYLDAPSKTDLLYQARALHKALVGLPDDGDDIVVETLQAIDQFVIDQNDISRAHLGRFFNSVRLERIAVLYGFSIEDEAIEPVRAVVHKLLIKLCTSSKSIAQPQYGWYFPNSKNPVLTSEDDYIDLGLESPYMSSYQDQIPVVNINIATFIQKLKPNQDNLQSSLLVSIFQAMPELVADYFSKRKQAPTPASEDASWRSFFAFILSVVENPVPASLGWTDGTPTTPPTPSVVAESILPQPIDRNYISKMLSSEDGILTVSAARLITVVLKKFENVRAIFHTVSATKPYLWQQAEAGLSNIIEARVPAIRDVSLAVQHHLGDQTCSALLECLLMYHYFLPNLATVSTFDIGPVMRELSDRLEKREENSLFEQLATCVEIAALSPSTKWFHKSDNDSLSPFSKLLRVSIQAKASTFNKAILSILGRVIQERGIMHSTEFAFPALCTSLMHNKKFSPSEEVFLFVDTCMVRVNQKPVKYLDDIETASQTVSDRKPLSLVVAAVFEQWSFAQKRYEGNKSVMKNIAQWIARLFALLDSAGENYRVMTHFQDEMLRGATAKAKEYLQEALDKARKKPQTVDETWQSIAEAVTINQTLRTEMVSVLDLARQDLEKIVSTSLAMPVSLNNLSKWSSDLDLELEINTKRLQRLILCISSVDAEVRLQAFQILRNIIHTVDNISSYDGKQQIYLILGELCETIIRYGGGSQPLPTIIPELANSLLSITTQPTHFMFSKVNKFLLHKPTWSAKGAILYWFEHILRQPPESDDAEAWNKEREWLLRLLIYSLREEIDLQSYRRCDVWEHVCSLAASPCISNTNQKHVLALIWQTLQISGGADMLWTRFGIHSWLSTLRITSQEFQAYAELLESEMGKRCNIQEIEIWRTTSAAIRKQHAGE